MEVWYAQQCVERKARLRGESNAHIQYRHLIDWLERKPGAFEHYRYREALYPSSRFRLAYDQLCQCHSQRQAAKAYLAILRLAAHDSEAGVDEALRQLIEHGQTITPEAVEARVRTSLSPMPVTAVTVAPVDLSAYDALLNEEAA